MVNNNNDKWSSGKANSVMDKYLYDLITASLEGNKNRAELVSLNIARTLSKNNPDLAKKIKELLGAYSMRGSSALRTVGVDPLPVDMDTHLEMATITAPQLEAEYCPILPKTTNDRIESFLEERKNASLLLDRNINPSNSLLLIGQPGTGKTLLAHYIASSLGKNLITLDLSASISSLLGKTGHNLKKVLQYARQTSSVLLLDEFDAIAKKRDDNTDLGEIKRVVNVLLMELEDWPPSSVLIATSNHPELLDKAIWRRFDHTIEIPLPELEQIQVLLKRNLGDFLYDSTHGKDDAIMVLAEILIGISAADVCKFSNNVKRRIILRKQESLTSAFHELILFVNEKKVRGKICRIAREKLKLTIKEISEITGLSIAGVQHHLN